MARIKLIPSLGFISQLFSLEECPLEFLSGPQESGPEREERKVCDSKNGVCHPWTDLLKSQPKGPGAGGLRKQARKKWKTPGFCGRQRGRGPERGPYQALAALGFSSAGTCLFHPEAGSGQPSQGAHKSGRGQGWISPFQYGGGEEGLTAAACRALWLR